MQYLYMSLLAVFAVAVDQITKWQTVKHFELGEISGCIPGLFSLTYVRNFGAAWSSFNGMIWLFCLIFAGFAAFIIWEFPKKRLPFTTFDRWCIVSVFAGGLGNMIDRLRLGYVVDMIHLDFMNFPVFNVADCFITCGCIALMVSLIFFNKDFWKDGKKCS